jgi:hypothetical protein
LARIAASQDGQRLAAILHRRREECRDQLERVPDPAQIHKIQGCADTLKQITDNLSEAREVVNKKHSH